MVRYSVVHSSCLPAMAFILALGFAPAVAHAQDRSTDDRLDRIERDLNMLERQVYRGPQTSGAVAAPTAGGGGVNAADIEIRMERVEAQMRDLTGRVEQIANGLDQLKQRIEQINSDFDVRFNELSGTAAAGPPLGRGSAAAAAAPPTRFAAGPTPPPASGLMPPGTVVPPPAGTEGGGGLNPIFNTLSPPGTAPTAPLSPAPSAAEPASTEGGLPRGSANEQFNY